MNGKGKIFWKKRFLSGGFFRRICLLLRNKERVIGKREKSTKKEAVFRQPLSIMNKEDKLFLKPG